MVPLPKVYSTLFSNYGPQGWWPLVTHAGVNPTKTGSVKGYHPGDYDLPSDSLERFEIICGAVLTQNTAWPNVEKALLNLQAINSLSPERLLKLSDARLKEAIRPAGYYNQKAEYLRNITKFFVGLKGDTPTRESLLGVKGVGRETADSILLYAYKQPHFVVDAYTRRIFGELGLVDSKADYGDIKNFFEKGLKRDVVVYQEFHALIVEHAKRHCKKKAVCVDCCLKSNCKK